MIVTILSLVGIIMVVYPVLLLPPELLLLLYVTWGTISSLDANRTETTPDDSSIYLIFKPDLPIIIPQHVTGTSRRIIKSNPSPPPPPIGTPIGPSVVTATDAGNDNGTFILVPPPPYGGVIVPICCCCCC